MAMLVAFAVAVLVAALVYPPPSGLVELAIIMGVAILLSLVGLFDDLRGLGIVIRLGSQVLAAVVLWFAGVQVTLTTVPALDLVITIVWVVGVTNALNLLDNMDGLSAGVTTIAALWFGIIGAVNGQVLVASLAFALAGCSLGFLRLNRPPARIYMGDAGSLFLGVVLATLGIKLRFESPPAVAALVPILILTIPVLDTTLVSLARVRHGLSPFAGGKDHISHRLVRVGLPVPVAVSLISGAGFAHGWMALLVSRMDATTAWLAGGLVATADVFLFLLLYRVPVYDNSRGRDFVLQSRVPDFASHEQTEEALK
ncbi:MAG: undecaprenyl/decaprenyl-phosphate alpha-N-acetylglucosaminyl 1-phosphate transferase [Actinobacteria bacterium]|nr:undecaprenyl/decaprenyl-phosphate alpha-N-acetylglucosaminyl 1-phosphate transferase [Actinomycetota bacterium]